jgi:hypothetical protein
MNASHDPIASPARPKMAGPEDTTEEPTTLTTSIKASLLLAMVQPADSPHRNPGHGPDHSAFSATVPFPILLLRPIWSAPRPTRR